ncbi:MAG: hypothetical protein Q8R37_01130 [Nanoarchaeota archaeon]|nr:hypothetical protein [Nanoarchaeota archaeon]
MDTKKRVFFVLAVVLVAVNIISFFITFNITGKAVSSTTGTSSICINSPPTIASIASQTATVSTAFTLNVSTADANNNAITFFDNTTLFSISQAGVISFTPSSATTENILITLQDNSSCINTNASTSFLLTINAAAEEAAPTTGGGPGGGGGGSVSPKSPEQKNISFKLSDTVLRVALKEARTIQKIITITNDGETELNFDFSNPLEKVIDIVPSSFILFPGQKQEVRVVFNPTQDAAPGIYSDFITVRGTFGGRIEKEIATVLEVESKEVLVDASLDLLKKTLQPGEELEATITLFNLRQTEPVDVILIYIVSRFNNSIVYQEQETITVKEQASFSKKIALAEDLKPGQYLLSLKIIYQDSFATATELFIVEEKGIPKKEPLILRPLPLTTIISTIGVLVIAILIISFFTYRRMRKARTVIKQTIVRPKTIIKQRTIFKHDASDLRRKLSLLREGRERGLISKEVYRQAKEKLQYLIQKRER